MIINTTTKPSSVFLDRATKEMNRLFNEGVVKPALGDIGKTGILGASLGGLIGLGKTYFQDDSIDNPLSYKDYVMNTLAGAGIGGLIGSGARLYYEVPRVKDAINTYRKAYENLPKSASDGFNYDYNFRKYTNSLGVGHALEEKLLSNSPGNINPVLQKKIKNIGSDLSGFYYNHYPKYVLGGEVHPDFRNAFGDYFTLDYLSKHPNHIFRDFSKKFEENLDIPNFRKELDKLIDSESKRELEHEFMTLLRNTPMLDYNV